MATAAKKKYNKMDPLAHILHRPDTYVGSTRSRELEDYISLSDQNFQIRKKTIKYCPAILRIFIEPLSNAIDNVSRSQKTKTPCTTIKVNVDIKSGSTSVWNDGECISVEYNDENKCYNHSLIFGQLLTSSNYDDEEDRYNISGRNGLGSKLCLKQGTLVPDFFGNILKVEDIHIGHQLIGDDGTPRIVTNKVTGTGRLFEVSQKRGNSYIVNEKHILCLKMPDHKVIFWNTAKNGWSMDYLKEKKIHMKSISAYTPEIICPECKTSLCGNLNRHYKRVHKDKDLPDFPRLSPTTIPPETNEVNEALSKMKEFSDTILDDNTLDISVKDYIELPKTTQLRLSGYLGECVQWNEQKVDLDPYVLGLWLGDGMQSGYAFSINSKDDPEILEYLEKWGEINDATFTKNQKNPIFWRISSKSKCRIAPMKKLLSKYNLINNKHIPQEYIVNSRKVRLSVLAGIIDSDGYVSTDGRRITITQGMNHSKLANDLIFLAKSLGFMCSSHIKKTQWKYKGEFRRGNAFNINISGKGVDDIPTLVQRKRCLQPLSRKVTNTGKLTVKEVTCGEYVGLSVDCNQRFVLEDFTVTHNCNVFSEYFSVQGIDPINKKSFFQEWTENMKRASEPEVGDSKLKKGSTEVSWIPDFKQFDITGYTQDIVDLYCRYVVDAAMLTNVNVYFNNILIPVKNLLDYSNLYSTTEEKDVLFIDTKDSQVIIMPSYQFQFVSFVNGVYTSLGGTHVDAWVEEAFRPLVQKLTKPKSSVTYTIGDVKKFFKIFVVVKVINPEFESQSKHKLESPVTATIKKSQINTMLKWSVMDDIQRSKEIGVLKKLERKKKNFVKIDGLDPANNEGGKLGHQCTLILVEGLAAKTYAVKGIEVGAFGKTGRDWFGIYALRGKVLNVRNAKAASIAKNNVVSDIIKSLGAKLDSDYTVDQMFTSLRYGKILIITDADVDGIHISGLIQNMVHSLFPTLLERTEPFITSMQTPIVRVFLPGGKKNELLFYDEREYQKYVTDYNQKNPDKKIDKKYYKGLGSSSDQDIVDTFGVKMIEFQNDENTSYNMNKIFHTNQSDARKIWLENYDVKEVALEWDGNNQETISLKMSDFLNTEMIKFSLNDCKRSIPGLMDGLKESHRKTLYACFKRNLRYTGKSLKVAQLAGYVAEHTAYHHGEQNLYDTITRMANSYPGSNNIPLLYRDGQFGTRMSGGKDAANARYIFTKLDGMTRLLFRPEDDILLDKVVDDGDAVEPVFYVPILPTILINGCTVGIGTGWSCSVPCYNPIDLITSVKSWLANDGAVLLQKDGTTVSLLPEIIPWYRGFTGEIERSGDARFTSWGHVSQENKTKVVDELPIGMWTDNFKEFLDGLQEEKVIKKVKNYSTPKKIRFVITEENDGIVCSKENLKLHKYIYTSNMVLFDQNGCIKKYDSVDEIINSFCTIRFEYYIKRKKYLLDKLNHDIKFLGNKKRFLEEVMNGTVKLFDDSGGGKTRKSKKTATLISDLEAMGYDKEIKDICEKEDEDKEDEETNGGYDYLLRLQFRSITEEKINKLKNDIASKIKSKNELDKTSEKEMWISDLDDFEKAYVKWLKDIEKEVVKSKNK